MSKYSKKLVLIDGHALVHRAFHALPPLATQNGLVTNAVYGFFSVLLKMIKDIQPDYIVATFDLASPTFRHQEFAQYKSHRVKAPDELHAQVPLIKEILGNFGIPIFEKEGFEADDMIGALAKISKAHKEVQVIIATGDLDTLQLVDDDKVIVLTPKKGVSDTVIYDEKAVKKRFGIKPNQMPDFKGLKGDPSDNIPGVAGVGDKTASELIKKFGSIEKIYETLKKEEGSKKKTKTLSDSLVKKLKESEDIALFSKRLATIITDIEMDFTPEDAHWRDRMDKIKLEKSLKDLGLFSIVRRLGEIDVVQDSFNLEPQNTETLKDEDIKKIESYGSVIILVNESGLEIGYKDVCGLVPLDAIRSNKNLVALIESESIAKILHNSKSVHKIMMEKDIKMSGVSFDIMLAAYLINAEGRDFSLERIYFQEFSADLPGGDKKMDAVLALKEKLEKRIDSQGLNKVLYEIEIPVAKVLAEMERAGILIDDKAISELSKKVNIEIKNIETKIYKLAGEEFNISSPKQLSVIIFDKLAIKGKTKKTSTGAKSTAASELEKLAGEHEIIDLILKYRELEKLRTTYIEPFPSLINKDTKRIHTTLDQVGAATGRLSSKDPNLQNIPARSELGQEFRKAFIVSPNKVLLSLDYSQIELRIVAHLSQDRKMLEIFKKGEDIHNRTAAEIFQVDPKAVTSNMRRDAKALNFGIIYGMGVTGFQRAVGKSREEAKQFIDRYLEEFSGVAQYMRDIKSKAHKDGYVSTMLGRRRSLPEINSRMPMLIAQAERIAINMPIQGAASDIIKIAMVGVGDLINKEYKGKAEMLLQVHDELLFEIDKDIAKDFALKVKKIMESSIQLDAPLAVEAKVGANWEEMDRL